MNRESAADQRPFVDTNVLLYLIGEDGEKAGRAEVVLAARITVSVQVLNEFANVARRKRGLGWPALNLLLADLLHFAEVLPLTLSTHLRGLALAQRYQLGLHDAMIAAAALEGGCTTLLSEDFQHGQLLDGQLRIHNPFV